MLIDVSCPFGRISYARNALKKVYVDKLGKFAELARELQRIRRMRVQIIPVIVSSLGAIHAESLDELEGFFSCSVKAKKKLGRQLSNAAIMGLFRLWRCYTQDMVRADDPQVGEFAAQEAVLAGKEQAIGQINEDQEAGSERVDDTGGESEREYEEPHDLTDEIETEGEQFEKEDGGEDGYGDGDGDGDGDSIEKVHLDPGESEAVSVLQRTGHDGQSSLGTDMEDFLGKSPQ
jgi:hypothetical protein